MFHWSCPSEDPPWDPNVGFHIPFTPIKRFFRFPEWRARLNRAMCLSLCAGTLYVRQSWGACFKDLAFLSHTIICIIKRQTHANEKYGSNHGAAIKVTAYTQRTELEQDLSWLFLPLIISLRRVLGGLVAQGHLFNSHSEPVTYPGKIQWCPINKRGKKENFMHIN